jgi:hypothetical protein
MVRSILVYDGSNRWFRAVADSFTRCSDDVVAIAWQSDAVQAFLQAQFDARPFAFILVDGDEVHVGSETVETVLEKGGVATGVSRLFKRLYPVAADPFGRLVHGQKPASIDGTFRLTEEARAHIDPLRRYRTIPVESAESDV